MKLLALTDLYGGRVRCHVGWAGHSFYFRGAQPDVRTLVTLELPGLTSAGDKAIVVWLSQRAGAGASKGRGRREIDEFPDDCWRPAVIEDLLDANNWQTVVWQLVNQFPLAEHRGFAATWIPRLTGELAPADTATGADLVKVLAGCEDRAARVVGVVSILPRRMSFVAEEEKQRLDRAARARLTAGEFDVAAWADLARRLRSHPVLREHLLDAATRLAALPDAETRIPEFLELIGRKKSVRGATAALPEFWTRLFERLPLPANVRDQTIDISELVEEKVPAGWELYEGRRVGPVRPGRTALVGRRTKAKTLFVRGERKLKFQIERAGGSIRKYGNTLTLGGDSADGLHRALLEVERLDALANLDPPRAAMAVESLGLPRDHEVYRTAAAAAGDPRHRRILADLLIELTLGVDADIARNLARAQSRMRR